MPLEVKVRRVNADVTTVACKGRITDGEAMKIFLFALQEKQSCRCKIYIISLKNVHYMDNEALSTLTDLAIAMRRHGKRMVFLGPLNGRVRSFLKTAKVDPAIEVFRDAQELKLARLVKLVGFVKFARLARRTQFAQASG